MTDKKDIALTYRSILTVVLTFAFACAPIIVGLSTENPALQIKTATAAAQSKNSKKQNASRGLSGSEGQVKRKVMFTAFQEGGCKGLYQNYVRAAGHSAYAGTAVDYGGESSSVCSTGLNAGSQAAAEKRAMAECANAVRRFKAQNKSMRLIGDCMIYASK